MTVVTSRPSRAWVHSDCSVYIALPSASRQITVRSGHATAAPVATGRPWPIAPPVSVSQSWRRRAGGGAGHEQPGGVGLVGRRSRPRAAARRSRLAIARAVSAPVGQLGPRRGRWRGALGGARRARRRAPRARRRASIAVGQRASCTSQPSGTRSLGLAGVGEERHRRLRVDEHEVARCRSSCSCRELGEVAEPLDRGQARRRARAGPGTSRTAAWRRWPSAIARRGHEPGLAQRARRREQRGRLAATAAPSATASTALGVGLGAPRRRPASAGLARRRTTTRRRAGSAWRPARRADGRGDRVGGVGADVVGLRRRAHPARHVAGDASRCRTRAARRTACGRSRGRRRC